MGKNKSGVTLSKKSLAVIVALALLLAAGGILLGLNWDHWFGASPPELQTESESRTDGSGRLPELDDGAVDWQGEQPQDPPQTADGKPGIAIPGYKELRLQADKKEQAVNLYNPATNTCYFVMSLQLPDGTQIWMIPPGKGLYQITLDQTVTAGNYENSLLKYACYKMDDQLTKLNGGEVKLTLEVE